MSRCLHAFVLVCEWVCSPWIAFRGRFLDVGMLIASRDRFLDARSNVFITKDQGQEQRPCANRVSKGIISDSVELWNTGICFSHIQLVETSVRLPKIQNFHRGRIRILSRLPAKSVGGTHSTMLRNVLHMIILSVITRVMNVGGQTSWTFVVDSSPFCDRSCKFVYWPKNVGSTHSCQVQAFQDHLGAHFGQFSSRFQFLLLEIMVVQTGNGNLYNCSVFFVCQFTTSFHSLFRMAFHIVWLRYCFLRDTQVIFQLLLLKFVIRTLFSVHQQLFRSNCIHVECVPNICRHRMMFFLQNHPTSSIASTWDSHSASFWCRPRAPILCFSNRIPMRLFSVSFPKIIQQVGDHPDFVQEELLGLQCWPKVWGHLCGDGRMHSPGHSDFGIFSNVGACSISCVSLHWYCVGCLSCTIWWTCNALQDLTCRRTLLSEYNIRAWSSVTMSLGSTTLLLYVWYFGSNSVFLRWPMSINETRWTFLLSLCASRITSFSFITLFNCHPGNFSTSFHSLFTATSASKMFVHSFLLPMWSSWFFDGVLSKRFLVDSWTCMLHAHFDFLDSVGSPIDFCGCWFANRWNPCSRSIHKMWQIEAFHSSKNTHQALWEWLSAWNCHSVGYCRNVIVHRVPNVHCAPNVLWVSVRSVER